MFFTGGSSQCLQIIMLLFVAYHCRKLFMNIKKEEKALVQINTILDLKAQPQKRFIFWSIPDKPSWKKLMWKRVFLLEWLVVEAGLEEALEPIDAVIQMCLNSVQPSSLLRWPPTHFCSKKSLKIARLFSWKDALRHSALHWQWCCGRRRSGKEKCIVLCVCF